jgi:hypothetical protein
LNYTFTIEHIKNDLEGFLNLSIADKTKVLGQALVVEIAKEMPGMAPAILEKIALMFLESDDQQGALILQTLENKDDFKARLSRACEMLQNS